MEEQEEISLINIIIDLFIICLSLSDIYIIAKYLKTSHRGFYCDDDTIRYPYKSSTIGFEANFALFSAIPVLAITVLELWLVYDKESLRRSRVYLLRRAVPSWAVRWARYILLFGLGLGSYEFIVNIAKFTVGRLRPHFLALCKPDVLCNATWLDPHEYITDYTCSNKDGFAQFQSRLSFPSGHTAMAFYGAMFTVLYIEKRVNWPDRMMVLKTSVQIIVFALAWVTGMSRIQDYKHHWGDVATGSIIGTLFAFFWVFQVLHIQTESLGSNVPVSSATQHDPPATDVLDK